MHIASIGIDLGKSTFPLVALRIQFTLICAGVGPSRITQVPLTHVLKFMMLPSRLDGVAKIKWIFRNLAAGGDRFGQTLRRNLRRVLQLPNYRGSSVLKWRRFSKMQMK